MLFRGCFEARAGQADIVPGTTQQLPATGLCQLQRFRNLGMCVIEHFPKQKDGSLDWCQALDQEKQYHRTFLSTCTIRNG